MAKKVEEKAKSNVGGKSRMKVFVAGFEMEGNDEMMAEGFKAIRDFSTAITRTTVLPPALNQKALGGGSKSGSDAGDATAVEVADIEPVEGTTVEVEDVEADDAAEEETSNGNGSGVKRQYNFKPPKFMDELDFSTASKSLQDFIVEKGNPTEMTDKYLATVVWFKDFMNIEEVTVHHVYTAFDHFGWKNEMPTNPSVPLRDLKSKRHMLTREPGAEGYKLNFKGIQHVGKMGATK